MKEKTVGRCMVRGFFGDGLEAAMGDGIGMFWWILGLWRWRWTG